MSRFSVHAVLRLRRRLSTELIFECIDVQTLHIRALLLMVFGRVLMKLAQSAEFNLSPLFPHVFHGPLTEECEYSIARGPAGSLVT